MERGNEIGLYPDTSNAYVDLYFNNLREDIQGGPLPLVTCGVVEHLCLLVPRYLLLHMSAWEGVNACIAVF